MCPFGLGGEYDGDRKMDDLKLLFRAYVTDALSSGRMEEHKVHKPIAYLSLCFCCAWYLSGNHFYLMI